MHITDAVLIWSQNLNLNLFFKCRIFLDISWSPYQNTFIHQVLEMLVRWLKHDWTSRRTHAPDLLKKVRLGLLPAEMLKTLLDDEMEDVPECRTLLAEVLQLQEGHSSIKLAQDFPNMFATRTTITVSYRLLQYFYFILFSNNKVDPLPILTSRKWWDIMIHLFVYPVDICIPYDLKNNFMLLNIIHVFWYWRQ